MPVNPHVESVPPDVVARLLAAPRYAHAVAFAGAGISCLSGLPLASEIKEALMQYLFQPDPQLAELWRRNRVAWTQTLRSVMLESIIETIVRNEPTLLFKLGRVFRGAEPTLFHHVLAALLARNRLSGIVTTNFDELIERAYAEERSADVQVRALRVILKPTPGSARGPVLLKLHGSASSPRSLSITLQQVGQGLEQWKQKALLKFASQSFVFIGYSDQDKDITPVLATLNNSWLWLLHNATPVSDHLPADSPILDLLGRRGVRVIHTDVPEAFRSLASRHAIALPPATGSLPDWREQLRRMLLSIDLPHRCILAGDVLYERLGDGVAAEAVYARGLSVRGANPAQRAQLILHRNRVGGDAWNLDQLEEALRKVDRLSANGSLLPPHVEALRLREWGTFYQKKSIRYSETAEKFSQDEERKWRHIRRPAEAAVAVLNRAVVLQKRGRYKAAEPLYQEAIAELRRAGQLGMVAKALSNYGSLLGMRRRNREALKAYEEGAGIFYMIGDAVWAARLQVNMGIVLTEMNRPLEAERILKSAHAVLSQMRDSYWTHNATEAIKQARRARRQ